MRDSRQIHERREIRLDRGQVVWLTLGVVVALSLMFAFGFVVGRRAASLAPNSTQDPIAQVDADGDLHKELTFYDRLTEPPKSPPRPRPQPQAEQPQTKKAASEQGREVKPSDAPEESTGPPAPVHVIQALAAGPALSGEYTIQVSAYQSMAEARAHAASLERKGYKPFIVTGHITGKGTWYRVRLGRFATQHDANRGKLLLAQADIPAWVLRTE
ncbi:SPOR domain-containing protein [Myxococcota bacterium]